MKKFELVIKSVCEYLIGEGYSVSEIKAMPYGTMVELTGDVIEFLMFNREENWNNHKERIVDIVVAEKGIVESEPVIAAEPVVEAQSVNEVPAVESNKSNGGVLMNKQIMNTIIAMATKSQYGSVTDYALYKELAVTANTIAADLNALYKEGYIKVKAVRNFKSIMPTSKAYKEFVNARPVSKEICMKLFAAVADMSANSNYYSVSYYDLKKAYERRVGAMSFEIALNKLVEAGYIKKATPTEKLIVFSATSKGMVAYQKVAGGEASTPAPAKKTYVKKEMSEEEKQRQALLRELAKYTSYIQTWNKKTSRGIEMSQDQYGVYMTYAEKATELRTALGIEV